MKKFYATSVAGWQGLSLLFFSVLILNTACQKGRDIPASNEDELKKVTLIDSFFYSQDSDFNKRSIEELLESLANDRN